MGSSRSFLLLAIAVLVLLPPAAAFGAGNIASISKIENHNFRHGDIEDTLLTLFITRAAGGKKFSRINVKRVYFGNWLRDYAQGIDSGTLKSVQAETIRILIWILGFLSFGYSTGEFEVTAERLGVYRPEEHIDNPRGYADDTDARIFDARLRPPVAPQELEIDMNTGLKNYIANEQGGWATSSGYIKFSFARSIHFGRVYNHGEHGSRGREEDLCEALRCLGQGLHCVEDFGAHTNYCELTLRELGFHNVFPHVGTATQINVHGKHIFPLVTGTFGGVDFLHSVLGEATDHITQSEIDEMDVALGTAATKTKGGEGGAQGLIDLLVKIPGTSSLCQEAQHLQSLSDTQAASNSGHGSRGFEGDDYSSSRASGPTHGQPPSFSAPPGSTGGPPGPGIPGMSPNFDPSTVVPKIYPILAFRDKVVRAISAVISKIPGLEKLVETISERVTIFVLSLLAPFIQPIIAAASKQLKAGSSTVVDASGRHQYEVWTNDLCTDPTHSLLSKDHFSNILNEPAGQVACEIVKYIVPRIVYAWDHPDVPVDEVLNDIVRVFHHPALRDHNCELHRNMFSVMERWSRTTSHDLNRILSSDSVRAGHNHIVQGGQGGQNQGGHGSHSHGGGSSSHSKTRDSPWDIVGGSSSGLAAPSAFNSSQPSPGPQLYPSSYNYDTNSPPYQPQSPPAAADPNYAPYGPSQPYYDHAQVPQAMDQYSTGYQSSYQQGFNDGNTYQQQPPPPPPGPGSYGGGPGYYGYNQQQPPPPGGYGYPPGPPGPYGDSRYNS